MITGLEDRSRSLLGTCPCRGHVSKERPQGWAREGGAEYAAKDAGIHQRQYSVPQLTSATAHAFQSNGYMRFKATAHAFQSNGYMRFKATAHAFHSNGYMTARDADIKSGKGNIWSCTCVSQQRLQGSKGFRYRIMQRQHSSLKPIFATIHTTQNNGCGAIELDIYMYTHTHMQTTLCWPRNTHTHTHTHTHTCHTHARTHAHTHTQDNASSTHAHLRPFINEKISFRRHPNSCVCCSVCEPVSESAHKYFASIAHDATLWDGRDSLLPCICSFVIVPPRGVPLLVRIVAASLHAYVRIYIRKYRN